MGAGFQYPLKAALEEPVAGITLERASRGLWKLVVGGVQFSSHAFGIL